MQHSVQTTLPVQEVKGSGRHGVVATPEIVDFNWFAWHMQSFSVTLPLTFFSISHAMTLLCSCTAAKE